MEEEELKLTPTGEMRWQIRQKDYSEGPFTGSITRVLQMLYTDEKRNIKNWVDVPTVGEGE